VVASGGGFLNDGDLVRVVDGATPPRPPRRRRVGEQALKELMMNVSAWSIRNPIPAVMLFVLLTFGGMLSFKAMKVQNFPDIDLPTVTVTASLPGAAPAQLETDVARKIENSIATVQGLKHIYTKVQDGVVTAHRRIPPGEAGAGSGGRRALRRRARARRPAGRPARPHRHQAGLAGAAGAGLHHRLAGAWTTKRCPGSSTTSVRASCWRCAAWARSTAWAA
jgi:hypothetical protein